MMKLKRARRHLAHLLPLGALAGGAAFAYALTRNLDKIYQGNLAYSPLSQALRFNGEENYGESWTFLINDAGRDLHVMLTLAICNPTDTSYLCETTAAYLSFACWHRGSGWQLVDRYPLHQFHASDDHGEVRLGPFQDPRCFFKEIPRDGLALVEVVGDLERETFLSNHYPGPLKDISWDFRFCFESHWYPDAWIDQARGASRFLKPAGVSLSCRATEISGGLKINDSFFEFNPEHNDSCQASLVHRWGTQADVTGPAVTCVTHAGESRHEPWAFLTSRFRDTGTPLRGRKVDPFSLLLSLQEDGKAFYMRNHPLRRRTVRAQWGEERLLPSRLVARGKGQHRHWCVEIVPDVDNSLDLVFPSPGGECIRRLWCPTSRLVILPEEKHWGRRPTPLPVDGVEMAADFLLEQSGGDWWDQVADMIEMPIDLSTF
jgi:hypothetical protein